MSDREFWKFFAGLIGALVALTVVLIIVAQVIASHSKRSETLAMDTNTVAERIKPVGEVSVARQAPPASPVMEALISSANAAGADKGKSVYDASCAACHNVGVAGAPKLGDKAAWKDRIAQGKDKLYEHSIKGFQGKAGFMPPKGGNMTLSDADVKAAVDYMLNKSQ